MICCKAPSGCGFHRRLISVPVIVAWIPTRPGSGRTVAVVISNDVVVSNGVVAVDVVVVVVVVEVMVVVVVVVVVVVISVVVGGTVVSSGEVDFNLFVHYDPRSYISIRCLTLRLP